jgi:hypothetical protein
MAEFAGALGAGKAASTLLVLFIPSRDRNDRAIDQKHWVDESKMTRNVKQIAEGLGAKVVGRVPRTGGGAFGAARLARIVESVQARLVPGQGKRAGRPSDASWVRHPKVPMSEAIKRRLTLLAERASDGGRKVSPMQIAAQILEDALTGMQEQ